MQDVKLNDEPGRLAALRSLEVLDTPPEEPFENIVALVRTVLGVPMAAVTLIDEDRQWFKARSGLGVSETPRNVSFCTYAIRQSEPMLVNDARLDSRFAENPYVTGDPNVRSYAGVPLLTPEGYNVGVLCAIDDKVRTFTTSEVEMLSNFARIVTNELLLRRIAERDQLTGALTRRGFIEKAGQEIARFRRYGRPCCLALLDIDHFKAVNDTYGHPAGDAVLREMVASVVGSSRPVDLLGRLGGEEFALLLPETEPSDALVAVERFREGLAGLAIPLPGGGVIHVTVSIGIAPLTDRIVTVEEWIAAADGPLYTAKRGGRNRCELLH
ncbi:sensor domain-containing diguanylate cyclase [Novosphingobium sp. PhB165]|uniref:sensor domain-containing diguanylate cyclase n=1 Tax=Novosphingobium sp. PhB165 TaxID=2485105 RepID=UPI00104F2793|nr:sensor domain-containing diguanylate cyclase [Novosphingobium sp. PhB165]